MESSDRLSLESSARSELETALGILIETGEEVERAQAFLAEPDLLSLIVEVCDFVNAVYEEGFPWSRDVNAMLQRRAIDLD